MRLPLRLDPPLAAATVADGPELPVAGVAVGRAAVTADTDQRQTELIVNENDPARPYACVPLPPFPTRFRLGGSRRTSRQSCRRR